MCHSCKSCVGVCAADMHCDMQVGDVLTNLVIANAAAENLCDLLREREMERQSERHCKSGTGCLFCGVQSLSRREGNIHQDNQGDKWAVAKWMHIWHMSELLNSLVSIKTSKDLPPTQILSSSIDKQVCRFSYGRETRGRRIGSFCFTQQSPSLLSLKAMHPCAASLRAHMPQ